LGRNVLTSDVLRCSLKGKLVLPLKPDAGKIVVKMRMAGMSSKHPVSRKIVIMNILNKLYKRGIVVSTPYLFY